MNKKGFTLVEVIIVIVIIGIIVVLAIPNILDEIEQNRIDSAKAVEKLLKHNLEMYDSDKSFGGFQYFDVVDSTGKEVKLYDRESDFWKITDEIELGSSCKYIDYKELITLNDDIKMGECLLTTSDKSLAIERVVQADSSSSNKYIATYKYYVNIVCGKHLSSDNRYTLNGGYNESDVYYKTTANMPNCN